MEILYILSILLLFTAVQGNENVEKEGELKREKKDIAKLQSLFGLNKDKQIPVVSYQDWKRPVYYVPPCNCWRPTTRYGPPVEDTAVYQYARPPAVVPAQPALRVPAPPSLVLPARPVLPPPPRPSFVVSAEPAGYAPPVIPSSPALATVGEPCIQREGGYSYETPQVGLNH